MANVRIYLDAGHGGKDSGASYKGRNESDDVLKLVLAIGKEMSARYSNVTIGYARKTDVYDSPSAKAKKGNSFNADYFFSFHRNCFNGSARGFETEYKSHSTVKDAIMNQIAAKMSDFGFTRRGDKQRSNLAVLNQTVMPALLFEVGFIDNPQDNKIFDNHFTEIVNAFVEVIGKNCGLTEKKKVVKASYKIGNYNKYVKTTKNISVHTGRGATYKKIGTLKSGTKVKALYILKSAAGNPWASIDYGKDIGYICLNNTTPV